MQKGKKLAKLLILVLALALVPVITAPAKTVSAQTVSKSTGRVLNGWVISGGNRYYYRNGKKVTGWQEIGGYRFYFNSQGQAMKGWVVLSGYRYYLNQYGRAMTGWITLDGLRFYLNSYGRALTGWQKIGSYRYYLNQYGRALTGWQTISGYRFYFDSMGRAATGTRTMNGITYTFNSYGRVIGTSDPVIYRAAVIGEADYQYATKLSACKYDAYAMKRVLEKTGYTTVKSGIDFTKSQIYNLIHHTFKPANYNDVSFFYYSGHGANDGSLYTVDGDFISTSTLAGWLKQIPGTVIVMLDSCYSGTVINKDSSGSVSVRSAKEFNSNVISAFANNNILSKSGEMCTSKFQVLTACKMTQLSSCYSTYSIFTEKLISGAGYAYATGNKLSSAPADYDSNKILSLYECWRYTYFNIYGQDAQCYTSNSSFKVFQRY